MLAGVIQEALADSQKCLEVELEQWEDVYCRQDQALEANSGEVLFMTQSIMRYYVAISLRYL